MIKGRCHTNLDDFRQCEWPEVFEEVPRIGDRVKAKDGKTLKVVGVTHTVRKAGLSGFSSSKGIGYEPVVEIELWEQPLKK